MFYDRFSDLCQKKGISPSTAAKEIGLSNSIITYWKRGATPKYDTAQKLASYFGVSVDYLLGKEEIKKAMDFFEKTIANNAESTPNNGSSSQEEVLLDSFHLLNEEGQQEAVKRVQELAEIKRYQARKEEISNAFGNLLAELPETRDNFVSALASIPEEGFPIIADHIVSVCRDPKAYLAQTEEERAAETVNLAKQIIEILENNKSQE